MRSDSMERIVPDNLSENETTGEDTLKLHLERYHFAAMHVDGDRVLDIACGAGYGTFILATSTSCGQVVGVDLDADAIGYARQRYAHPKISFEVADACTYAADVRFDTIVTLETIEHLPDPAMFVANLGTLVKPGGRIIASTPVTPSVDANPHHLTDFTPRSFRKLFVSRGYKEVGKLDQVQDFSPVAIASKREKRAGGMRRNLGRYYVRNPGSLARRILATIQYGFSNRYATIVWEKPRH